VNLFAIFAVNRKTRTLNFCDCVNLFAIFAVNRKTRTLNFSPKNHSKFKSEHFVANRCALAVKVAPLAVVGGCWRYVGVTLALLWR
jgi:hypothetical protein